VQVGVLDLRLEQVLVVDPLHQAIEQRHDGVGEGTNLA
jgi:hypothetical protein